MKKITVLLFFASMMMQAQDTPRLLYRASTYQLTGDLLTVGNAYARGLSDGSGSVTAPFDIEFRDISLNRNIAPLSDDRFGLQVTVPGATEIYAYLTLVSTAGDIYTIPSRPDSTDAVFFAGHDFTSIAATSRLENDPVEVVDADVAETRFATGSEVIMHIIVKMMNGDVFSHRLQETIRR